VQRVSSQKDDPRNDVWAISAEVKEANKDGLGTGAKLNELKD